MTNKRTIAPREMGSHCWGGHDVMLEMVATDGIRAMYRGTCSKCNEEIKITEVLKDERNEETR